MSFALISTSLYHLAILKVQITKLNLAIYPNINLAVMLYDTFEVDITFLFTLKPMYD